MVPPKKKFSREQIIEAGFDIACNEGMGNITIRKVAGKLGSSVAPIYVNFRDVEQLKEEVAGKILELLQGMIKSGNSGSPFRDIGAASIRFAREYSILYRELVLTPNDYLDILQKDTGGEILGLMKKDPELAGFSEKKLEELLFRMRVFQTGISAMTANGFFPDDIGDGEIIKMMEDAANDFIAAARLQQEKEITNE